MSLTKVTDNLPPNATFNPYHQAEYLSQIIPAYKEGVVGVDEIYILALYSSPVSACPLYKVEFHGFNRIMRFV